jgi:cell fate (sporulation/competence/biofilm development) regulator YmcA (YheA/YmcA/DUF963 family)
MNTGTLIHVVSMLDARIHHNSKLLKKIETIEGLQHMRVEATANFVGMIHALTEIRDELQAQIEADINAYEISQGM